MSAYRIDPAVATEHDPNRLVARRRHFPKLSVLTLIGASVLAGCQGGLTLRTSAPGLTAAEPTSSTPSGRGRPARSTPPTTAQGQSPASSSRVDPDAKFLADVAAAKAANDGARIGQLFRESMKDVRSDGAKAAADALFEMGDFKSLSAFMLNRDNAFNGETILNQLAAARGADVVTAAVKKYWSTATFTPPEGSWGAFNAQRDFLTDQKAVDSALCPSVLKIIGGGVTTITPLQLATSLKCHVDANLLKRLLSDDNPWVRKEAATTAGALHVAEVKPLLLNLRDNDGYWDPDGLNFPVRAAAALALVKLTSS